MKPHRTIVGLDFLAHSPSLLEYHGAYIGYDGHRWLVGALGQWGRKEFLSAHEAALVVRAAFYGQEAVG